MDRNDGPQAAAKELWYALYTRGRHEKRVDALLEEREFEAYLPLVPRVRQWHDRRKTVHFPLFPSYLFVRASLPDLSEVLRVPGVVDVVRFGARPIPIPDREIANVRRLVRALEESGGESATAEPLIEEGEPVEVVSGPFEGVRGILLERRGSDRALLQVGLEAIRQGVRLEVRAGSLRPMLQAETTAAGG